jgi:hypothetical protein
MTLDECIAYLQNVSLERKPRSRKARQILNYLQEYKAVLEQNQYDKGYKDGYKAGWNSCIRDSADGWMVDYMD